MNPPDPIHLIQTYQHGYSTAMQASGTRDKGQQEGMIGGLMAVLERFGGGVDGGAASFSVPPPPTEKPQDAKARRDDAFKDWVEEFRADIPQGSIQIVTDAFRGGASGLEYEKWVAPRQSRIPAEALTIVEDAFHNGADYEQWWTSEGYLPPDMAAKVAEQRAAEAERIEAEEASARAQASQAQTRAAARAEADAEASEQAADAPQPAPPPAAPPAAQQAAPTPAPDEPAMQEDAHLTAQPPAP